LLRTRLPTDVGIRDLINAYGGSKYGIQDYDIGYDNATGKVTLGGQALPVDISLEGGRSYGDEYAVTKAIDSYAKSAGLQDLTAYKPPEAPAMREAPTGPTYQDPYAGRINDLLDEILGAKPYSYNPEQDPMFSAARDRYMTEAARTGENTLGAVSGMTGGHPSSWAVTAAGQAQNQLISQFEGTVAPQLEQAAYQRYLNEQAAQTNNLQTLLGVSGQEYGRYTDALNQYNQDRSFDRSVFESDRSFDRSIFESDRAVDYQITRDRVLDNQWMQQFNVQEKQRIIDNAFTQQQITLQEKNYLLNKYQAEKAGSSSGGSTSTAKYSYKTDPQFAEEVQWVYDNPTTAVEEIKKNAAAIVNSYGYDGLKELLRIASPSNSDAIMAAIQNSLNNAD
jgi:hypothetical protein